MQLICQATCYMPVRRGDREVDLRFEDGDVVEVSKARAKQYLASGNFNEVTAEVENPILGDDQKESIVVPEEEEAVGVAAGEDEGEAGEGDEPTSEPED